MEVRATTAAAAYLVGDASGSGFGDCLWVQGEDGMNIAFGSWNHEVSECSSNFREGYNLVLRLESLLLEGAICQGTELWVFTDNAVAESSFNKGASKSKLLHELCVRLRKAEMTHSLHVNMVWIAGTRMIAQGTDGLLRGDLTSGVMAGDSFLSHIPLDLEAFARSPALEEWLASGLPREWQWLRTGEDWYRLPFENSIGRYVWNPPPALADVALEQLCEVKLMHPFSSHVFVCPLLLTGRWRKQSLKAADAWFTVPVVLGLSDDEAQKWTSSDIRCMLCSGIVTQLHGVVCANFGFQRGVSPGACKGAWHGACYQQSDKDNFPVFNQEIEAEDLVSDDKMEEEDPKRFKEARDGDHLMTPFQCDLCHFENCKRRCPIPDNMQDEVALLVIRRANLDALWSRERSTVRSNRLQGKHWVSASESAGWSDHALPKRGPFPVEDVFGMQAAVNMLLRSRDVGINSKTIQYETMRKLRSFLSNFVHTTYGGHGDTFMSEDGGGGTVSMSPTNSPWFKRFMRGVHKRMGDVWIPDRALMKRELMLCLTLLEEDWLVYSEGNDGGGKLKAGLTATMLIAGWFAALRGEEIVRIDVGQMRQHWDESVNHTEEPHVPLMLSGRFKREIGEKVYCQPLAMTSNSGVKIGEWMWRTLETLGQQNVLSGPMFRVAGKGKGVYKRATTADLNPSFINILARVQKRWANAFAGDLDIEKEFSIGRSLRRGVTSEAQNVGIPREVIEANNRWRRQARAKGLTPGMSMMERYSDAKASVPTLVRFSKEL